MNAESPYPPVSKTIVAAKARYFKEIMGERGLNLPDIGFLRRQERYYGVRQVRFLRADSLLEPSACRHEDSDAAAAMGNNGNDSYLRGIFSLSGMTNPLYFSRKSLLPLLPFPSALVNKNQVVSEINCPVEYVEQFTKHLCRAENVKWGID
ncbi:MAG: hypothetical protein ABIF19_04620 [Planctomycetota bacterium]